MTTKKPSGAVRLFVWECSGWHYCETTAKEARRMLKCFGGTYLGEYIARPVVKKKGKRRGK